MVGVIGQWVTPSMEKTCQNSKQYSRRTTRYPAKPSNLNPSKSGEFLGNVQSIQLTHFPCLICLPTDWLTTLMFDSTVSGTAAYIVDCQIQGGYRGSINCQGQLVPSLDQRSLRLSGFYKLNSVLSHRTIIERLLKQTLNFRTCPTF